MPIAAAVCASGSFAATAPDAASAMPSPSCPKSKLPKRIFVLASTSPMRSIPPPNVFSTCAITSAACAPELRITLPMLAAITLPNRAASSSRPPDES